MNPLINFHVRFVKPLFSFNSWLYNPLLSVNVHFNNFKIQLCMSFQFRMFFCSIYLPKGCGCLCHVLRFNNNLFFLFYPIRNQLTCSSGTTIVDGPPILGEALDRGTWIPTALTLPIQFLHLFIKTWCRDQINSNWGVCWTLHIKEFSIIHTSKNPCCFGSMCSCFVTCTIKLPSHWHTYPCLAFFSFSFRYHFLNVLFWISPAQEHKQMSSHFLRALHWCK